LEFYFDEKSVGTIWFGFGRTLSRSSVGFIRGSIQFGFGRDFIVCFKLGNFL
jgi:hypothetical protein